MAELKIDVTKLVGRCCEMVLDETEYAGKTLRGWINDITNGDYVPANVSANKAAPVKHGYWRQVKHEYGQVKHEYKCSICGADAGLNYYREHRMTTRYCPNCGAKMDEGLKK